MKLEQIAPYLAFDLQILHSRTVSDFTEKITGTGDVIHYIINSTSNYDIYKPILRPMENIESYFSDLFDDDIDVRTFLNDEFLESRGIDSFNQITELKAERLPYGIVNLLAKHHFDIFGLIEKGLAVSFSSIS